MPRIPGIGYFDTRSAFYTRIDNVQHRLAKGPDDRPDGPTYRKAQAEFNRLMDERKLLSGSERLTLNGILRSYCLSVQGQLEDSTLITRKRKLKGFLARYGERYASSITPREITNFVSEMRSRDETKGRDRRWNCSTATVFLHHLSALYSWSIKESLTLENPVSKVHKPGIRSRGRHAVLNEEQHRVILGGSTDAFGELAEALAHTGARPGELIKATAADWDDDNGCLVFHGKLTVQDGENRHKNSRKNKTRRIFFQDDELQKMRARVGKRPRGTLFRNFYGQAWTMAGLTVYVTQLKKRLNLPHFSCYSWRHTFATKWILAGKSIDFLAELLGNSPQTIRLYYSHLDADLGQLRGNLKGFRSLS